MVGKQAIRFAICRVGKRAAMISICTQISPPVCPPCPLINIEMSVEDGGQAGNKIWSFIDFKAACLPTLRFHRPFVHPACDVEDGGQAGNKIWSFIDFKAACLPTLRFHRPFVHPDPRQKINKSINWLNRHIPGLGPSSRQLFRIDTVFSEYLGESFSTFLSLFFLLSFLFGASAFGISALGLNFLW